MVDREKVTDFLETVDEKVLKGTACDPDEAILVTIYSKSKAKYRNQLLKRRKLIDRVVLYEGVDNGVYVGRIIAFYKDTGHPVLFIKDNIHPKADGKIIFVER